MAGHSRPRDGIASLARVPAIHVFGASCEKAVDARHKAGHGEKRKCVTLLWLPGRQFVPAKVSCLRDALELHARGGAAGAAEPLPG
jgi:hypothetical protein